MDTEEQETVAVAVKETRTRDPRNFYNIPPVDPEVREEHKVDWGDWRVWLGGFLALCVLAAAYPFIFYNEKYWEKSFIKLITFK